MTDTDRMEAGLDGPSELLSAVPHMVGFYPHDSLIVLTFRDVHTRPYLASTMRLDLPAAGDYDPVVAAVIPPLLADPACEGVVVIVAAGAGDIATEGLPHAELVAQLGARTAELGIPMLQAFWTPEFRAGAPWGSYLDPLHTGTVADPDASAVGAACALAGEVTYSSRREMENLLAPAYSEEDEARWRAALDRLAQQATARDAGEQVNSDERLVIEAIQVIADGGEVTEAVLIGVLHAISDARVRDAALTTAIGPHARAAEHLWRTLIRSAPAHAIAEPAVLLAFSAYVHGNGALTAIALDRALHADPDHALATLLARAHACGIRPSDIASIVE